MAKHIPSRNSVITDNIPGGLAKNIPSLFCRGTGINIFNMAADTNGPRSEFYSRKSGCKTFKRPQYNSKDR